MQTIATINPVSVQLSPDLMRVDVMAENVPANLFGAAFHLRIRGGEWSLENFMKGDVFRGELFSPLIMAEERQTADGLKEIVFGMTLKRTDLVPARDGKLVSFNLKVEPGAVLTADLSDLRLVVAGESVAGDELASTRGALVTGETAFMAETQSPKNPGALLNVDLLATPALGEVYLVMALFAGFSLFVFLIYLFVRRLFGQTRG